MVGLPRLSLSQRLFVLTALALAPALSILAFNEVSLRQSREAEISTFALRMGELASLEMERIITGAAALMVAVASAPVVRGEDLAACSAYLGRLQSQLPQLSVIGVTGTDGSVRCATSTAEGDVGTQATSELRARVGDGVFAVGEYVETSKGPGLQLAASIRSEAGVEGYVISAISLDYLGRLLREREDVRGNALTIADRDGIIIAREPFPERFVGTSIPDDFRDLVTAAEPGTRRVQSQDGTERIIGYYPAGRPIGLYVSAGVATADAFRPIDEATRRGLALAGVGGLLAMLIAWLFGHTFIRQPVLRLTDTIAAWRAGDVTARTGMREGAGELDAVGATIDDLLDELAARQRAQQAAEKHRDLLNAELDHRIKNLLSTVQAIAAQTFRRAGDVHSALTVFAGRLTVLGRAHQILTARHWHSAPLDETVRAVLAPFDTEAHTRFRISGPDLHLRSKAALTLAMALHELCTNAVKYGALSAPEGCVDISWQVSDAAGDRRFALDWRESGGPPVSAPDRNGFGSRMIEQALAAELGAEVRLAFETAGVACTISAPLERIAEAEAPATPA